MPHCALDASAVETDSTETTAIGTLLSNVISDIYVLRALEFTLFQAFLSALFSTLAAIPLARAFACRDFPGRSVILALFGAPFILPVIVAILGILAVYGKNGLLHSLGTAMGFSDFSIFGLGGILLAHIFFNLPLATRILLQGWFSIPPEQWRLASQLGMTSQSIARHIEWPMLKQRLPGAFSLIFLLCVSSFTVILALGGGPKATTIELAIYQAIRFDFDLDRAALLAILQIALCAGLALLFAALSKDHDTGTSIGAPVARKDRNSQFSRTIDWLIILSAIAFLALPLLAAFLRGAYGLAAHGIDLEAVFMATLRSLAVSLGACITMLAIALPLTQISIHANKMGRRLLELPGYAIMVAPPIALGAGLFVLLHQHIAIDDLALPLASLLNGLQAIPIRHDPFAACVDAD